MDSNDNIGLDENHNFNPSDLEVLISQNDDYSVFQVKENHSLVSKLFQEEAEELNKLDLIGNLDLESMFLLRSDDMYIININLKLKTIGGRIERKTLVAMSTDAIDSHFMYTTTVSGVENFDSGTGDKYYSDMDIYASQIGKLVEATIKTEPMASFGSPYDWTNASVASLNMSNSLEDSCIEDYYFELKISCGVVMACDLMCALTGPMCAVSWAFTASVRCFWEWYYGIEHYAKLNLNNKGDGRQHI
ncbi:MAG: hypothetical protein ACJAVN_000852 [Roseivirga sp.]|jgi:hypothetical protein